MGPVTVETDVVAFGDEPAALRSVLLVHKVRQMVNPFVPDFDEPRDEVLDEPAAVAEINRNRWVVRCPFPGCTSAQLAADGDRRFFCIDCRNGGTNAYVRVVWPSKTNRAAIERLIGERPDHDTRNWLPHEKVKDLQAENEIHGHSPRVKG